MFRFSYNQRSLINKDLLDYYKKSMNESIQKIVQKYETERNKIKMLSNGLEDNKIIKYPSKNDVLFIIPVTLFLSFTSFAYYMFINFMKKI